MFWKQLNEANEMNKNEKLKKKLKAHINKTFSLTVNQMSDTNIPAEYVDKIEKLNDENDNSSLSELFELKMYMDNAVAKGKSYGFKSRFSIFKNIETTKASLTALLFLVLFFSLAVLKGVNEASSRVTILDSWGYKLFYNLLFSIAIAGLGASFRLLHALRIGKIKNFRLELVIEGVFSGFILAEILYTNIPKIQTEELYLGKFLFAFFGGMTSGILYGLMERIITSLGIIVSTQDSSSKKNSEDILPKEP